MVLNTEKRARLVGVLFVRDNATTGKAGTSTHPAPPASPASPTAPLAPSVQTTPTSTSPHATPASPHAAPALASPTPIAVIPLATIKASPPPSPLEKNKGVVFIASDDVEGSAFERRKTTMVATSNSSSARRPASVRDNPPSASSPLNFLALDEGVETVPEPTPAPALELPLVLQQILRGYQQDTMGNFADEALTDELAQVKEQMANQA